MPSITAQSESLLNDAAPKDARLDLRSTASQKSIIETAAALSGESVTSFVLSTLLGESLKIIQEHDITDLTLRDWERFNSILTAEAEPNSNLTNALKQYNKRVSG